MASVTRSLDKSQSTQQVKTGHPPRSLAFDYQMMVLGAFIVLGAFLDGWAHNHGKVDDSFFTPWHGILYGGYAIAGLRLVLKHFSNVGRGYRWSRALPKGYMLSLMGVGVFGIAGVADMLWHTAFGIEENIEALLSPSHISLLIGALLIVTGPLRAAWADASPDLQSGWRALAPAILGATGVYAMLSFFMAYGYFTEDFSYLVGSRPGGWRQMIDAMGVVALLVPSILLVAHVLFLRRRWRLPFGTVTFMVCAVIALMTWFSLNSPQEFLVLIPMAIAGLIADVLLARFGLTKNVDWLRLMAFVTPFAVVILFMVFAQQLSGQQLWWKIHMWLGTPVLAGVLGFLLSFVAFPPVVPSIAD
ncbi:MAG: hypothetical protein KC615_10615 [Anaerolineae bacterium]|nr:hypothetical protein [Anaerolineae bacterium]